MTMCYPSTPGKMASTAGIFITGVALFFTGLHYAYVNIAPQQARIKARNEYILRRLNDKYGYEPPKFYDESTWKVPRRVGTRD